MADGDISSKGEAASLAGILLGDPTEQPTSSREAARRAALKRGAAFISITVEIFRRHACVVFYPFRWKLRFFGTHGTYGGWHIVAGPFHIWGMGGRTNEFASIGLNFGRDPFWGSAMSMPPGSVSLFGKVK